MSHRQLTDQRLQCAGCGDGFVFSAGEQELFQLRGLAELPDQCPACLRGDAHHLARHHGSAKSRADTSIG